MIYRKWNLLNKPFAHFRIWFWYYTFCRSYIPFRRTKGSLFMQSSMKITYIFSNNLFKIFNDFLYPMIFYKVQIFTNYDKIKLKFIVLYIGVARPGTSLTVLREIITCIKKGIKTYNFRNNLEKCQRSILPWMQK